MLDQVEKLSLLVDLNGICVVRCDLGESPELQRLGDASLSRLESRVFLLRSTAPLISLTLVLTENQPMLSSRVQE